MSHELELLQRIQQRNKDAKDALAELYDLYARRVSADREQFTNS